MADLKFFEVTKKYVLPSIQTGQNVCFMSAKQEARYVVPLGL